MYELIYNNYDGAVSAIRRLSDGASIPLDKLNTDFQTFLVRNAQQAVPLDLDSTIEIVVPEPATQQVFELPVVAPDFIVQSPRPKSNHLDAHTEVITESKKKDKSIALMVMDMAVYIEELEKRLQKKGI